jgi:hypothetical protein
MFCPSCISSTAMVVGGVTSVGGVLAYLVERIRRISGSRKRSQQAKEKEKES